MQGEAPRMIDLQQYPRKAHFDYFRSLANPSVGVTVEVDVTDLLAFCRERKVSFYLAFMHAAALAADCVPELRQRIRGEGIVEYASCGTSHVEDKGDGTYCYCTLHHHMPFDAYIRQAETARKACRENAGIEEDDDVESLYFVSCLPWLHYTQLVQPTAGGDESNPRITWGRYDEDPRGRFMMPVTLLCHHALVDGRHLGAFYQQLETQMFRIIRGEC